MNPAESPLTWPQDFPPTSRWALFWCGVRGLGPDVSFFKDLRRRQAARTEAVMAAWTDEQARRVALLLGEGFQRELGWKTPYFIPADQAVTVAGGISAFDYLEMDEADLVCELEERLGKRMKAGFWEAALNWNDRSASFGDLVGKVMAELQSGCGLPPSP